MGPVGPPSTEELSSAMCTYDVEFFLDEILWFIEELANCDVFNLVTVSPGFYPIA